jgi:hypothetical protein
MSVKAPAAKLALPTPDAVPDVLFSLSTIPSHDPQLDSAEAVIDLFSQARKTARVAIGPTTWTLRAFGNA